MSTIGQRLKQIRGKESRESFAKRFGVHRNTLGRWEAGERSPDFSFIVEVTKAYEFAPDWVLLGQGPKKRNNLPTSPEPCLHCQELEAQLNEKKTELHRVGKEFQEERVLNRELASENRQLLKENADLRVELERAKARAAPSEEQEETRKSA